MSRAGFFSTADDASKGTSKAAVKGEFADVAVYNSESEAFAMDSCDSMASVQCAGGLATELCSDSIATAVFSADNPIFDTPKASSGAFSDPATSGIELGTVTYGSATASNNTVTDGLVSVGELATLQLPPPLPPPADA